MRSSPAACNSDIGASGLLFGPNGIGKSYICGSFIEKLPEKRYKILSLAHSSLTGSDLIRALCRQLGVPPQMRRSDNVANIHAALAQLGSRWPLLVLEEAQNFSATALEEVRLLTCARTDTRPPFSLLLVGDERWLFLWQANCRAQLSSDVAKEMIDLADHIAHRLRMILGIPNN